MCGVTLRKGSLNSLPRQYGRIPNGNDYIHVRTFLPLEYARTRRTCDSDWVAWTPELPTSGEPSEPGHAPPPPDAPMQACRGEARRCGSASRSPGSRIRAGCPPQKPSGAIDDRAEAYGSRLVAMVTAPASECSQNLSADRLSVHPAAVSGAKAMSSPKPVRRSGYSDELQAPIPSAAAKTSRSHAGWNPKQIIRIFCSLNL